MKTSYKILSVTDDDLTAFPTRFFWSALRIEGGVVTEGWHVTEIIFSQQKETKSENEIVPYKMLALHDSGKIMLFWSDLLHDQESCFASFAEKKSSPKIDPQSHNHISHNHKCCSFHKRICFLKNSVIFLLIFNSLWTFQRLQKRVRKFTCASFVLWLRRSHAMDGLPAEIILYLLKEKTSESEIVRNEMPRSIFIFIYFYKNWTMGVAWDYFFSSEGNIIKNPVYHMYSKRKQASEKKRCNDLYV